MSHQSHARHANEVTMKGISMATLHGPSMMEDFPDPVELDPSPLPPLADDDLPEPVVLDLPPPAPTHAIAVFGRRKRAKRTTISPSRRVCKHCTKVCAASLTDQGRTYLSSLRADCHTAHRGDNELKARCHAWTCSGAMHTHMHACRHVHSCAHIFIHVGKCATYSVRLCSLSTSPPSLALLYILFVPSLSHIYIYASLIPACPDLRVRFNTFI